MCVCVVRLLRPMLRLVCFRLLGKNKYLFNIFRARDNQNREQVNAWVSEWRSVCVWALRIVYSTRLRSMTSIWMHNWVRAHHAHVSHIFFFPPNVIIIITFHFNILNNFSYYKAYGCPTSLSPLFFFLSPSLLNHIYFFGCQFRFLFFSYFFFCLVSSFFFILCVSHAVANFIRFHGIYNHRT